MSQRANLIFFGIFLSLGFWISTIAVSACDPLGCLLIGDNQDVLALVTVTGVHGDAATVISEHTYQQTRLSIKNGDSFSIQFQNGTPWIQLIPRLDAHYLVSLTCTKDVCAPKWGAWEVDSADFQSAKLVEIQNGDDAAVQWFMNGKGSDFYGVDRKMFARSAQGDIEIYPQYEQIASQTHRTEPGSMTDVFQRPITRILGSLLFLCVMLFTLV